MLEVWGRKVAVRYDGGRVVTQPLQADDEVALDVPVAELRRARIATTEDGRIAVLLYFRSPDYVVNGVPAQHHPVPVFLEPERREQAAELVRAIEKDLLGLHRVFQPRPDFTVPPLLLSPHGPMREDVTRAAQRMRFAGHSIREITALQQLARGDEYVLELAQAAYERTPGLVAITTLRLLFVCAATVYELPVAALDRAEVVDPAAPGAVATLKVQAGPAELEFIDWEPVDFARVAQALRLAVDIEHVDGSVLASRPSSVDLFAEWQLLVERRRLGMVEDEPFQRQAVGIMIAMGG
ncbi:hypothetical protein [Nocardia huaxiensis]|uniref:Uncharacterized protein n=1 Tax=Nocardia huaxiensis TaxID=2755382 RepID=A0A7D6ZJL7_9NOCA|nr:hypothetical protein [Nocardia huaxiensis]QLY32639.1 hypothetical protein H0264_10615 [Nocardia huaxiensis]UFS93628.1 hypothetical protein LPY97_22760 [Nocardia huaxiensis]